MTSRKIKFIDLPRKFGPYLAEFKCDLERIVNSGSFILGGHLAEYEKSVLDFMQAKHTLGVGNGTDALILSLKAIGVKEGDEVITTPMSYLASTSTIALCGATAVFVDVDASLNMDPEKLEEAITQDTKAIVVVHFAGIPAQVQEINRIADKYKLAVIEDCAQSLGATVKGKAVGTFGRFGTVSFHPLKNLGTLGDGGMIVIQDRDDFRWLKMARNHGHSSRDECEFWSMNSRLDDLHATFLNTQLKKFPQELKRRRELACIYRAELAGVVSFPSVQQGNLPSYNWFMILAESRGKLIAYLQEKNIETKVHYYRLISMLKASQKNCKTYTPITKAEDMSSQILSLPIAEHITEDDVYFVCDNIKQFYV